MKYLFISALGVLLLASCATSVPIMAPVEAYNIDKMAMFEPASYIGYIEKGNRSEYHDSLSAESAELTARLILERPDMPSIEILTLADSSVNETLREELEFYITELRSAKPANRVNVQIPQTAENVLKASGYRFGLIVYTEGFTRREGNYGGQVAVDAAISVGASVLLGVLGAPVGVMRTSVKARSTVSCFIIDAEGPRTAFYHQFSGYEAEPLEEKTIKKQLDTIFKDYFNNYNPVVITREQAGL